MERSRESDDPPSAHRRSTLPPFAAMRAFEAVGRLGGIRKAADHLAVHQAVVSRHIRALEAVTGVRLIERNHSGIVLTSKGVRYFERIGSAFSEIASATDELVDLDDRTLKVWCTPGFAVQSLLPMLDQFGAANPELTLEVRPTDRVPDLRRAEADLHICRMTAAPRFDRRFVRWFEIAAVPTFPVAAPDLAERHGDLDQPAGVRHAPLIHNGDQSEWQAWFAARGMDDADTLHGPVIRHSQIAIDAAKRGDGILLSDKLLVGDAMAGGDLVRVLPRAAAHDPVLGSYYCVGGIRRWNSQHAVDFRRSMIRFVRASLDATRAF